MIMNVFFFFLVFDSLTFSFPLPLFFFPLFFLLFFPLLCSNKFLEQLTIVSQIPLKTLKTEWGPSWVASIPT